MSMPNLKWPDEAVGVMLCYNCDHPIAFLTRLPRACAVISSSDFIGLDGEPAKPQERLPKCPSCGFQHDFFTVMQTMSKRHYQLGYGNGSYESLGLITDLPKQKEAKE